MKANSGLFGAWTLGPLVCLQLSLTGSVAQLRYSAPREVCAPSWLVVVRSIESINAYQLGCPSIVIIAGSWATLN